VPSAAAFCAANYCGEIGSCRKCGADATLANDVAQGGTMLTVTTVAAEQGERFLGLPLGIVMKEDTIISSKLPWWPDGGGTRFTVSHVSCNVALCFHIFVLHASLCRHRWGLVTPQL
jgi:hypothetical protein